MAEMILARVTLKVAWNLFAPSTAARFEQGDVAEEKIRQVLLNEFQKIQEHLNALRRKELVAAIALLETGFELLRNDPITSKEEFHKAREHSQMAFGVVADISDKILATKILVVSTLHEFHDNTSTAKSLCSKYLERMNTMQEVIRSCEIAFSPDSKLSSWLLASSGKTKRVDLLQGVAEVNKIVYDYFVQHCEEELKPSPIRFGKYHIDPVSEMILYRKAKVISEINADLTDFISVCYAKPYIFASLSRKQSLNNDIIALNLEDNSVKHLLGHENIVLSVCALRGFMCSSSYDQNIIVWDIKSLMPYKTLHDHKGSVSTLCCSIDYLLSGSTDSTVKVWDINKDFECRETLEIGTFVSKLTCSQRKYLFCLCGRNAIEKEVQIWDLHNFLKLHAFKTTDKPYDLIANDNLLLLPTRTLSSDIIIQSLNLGSLTSAQNFTLGAGNVVKCYDTPYIFCGDKEIKMFSTSTGKLIMEETVVVLGKSVAKIKSIWLDLYDLYALCEMQNGQNFILKY